MTDLEKILLIALGLALVFWLVQGLRRPKLPADLDEPHTPSNLSRSFTTMGILALILIGFVAALVFYLRHT